MTSLRSLHAALPEKKQQELIAKSNSQIADKKTDRAFNEYPQNALLDEKNYREVYQKLESIFVANGDLKEQFMTHKKELIPTGIFDFDQKTKEDFIAWYNNCHQIAMNMLLDGRGNLKADLIQRYGWQDNPEVYSLKFLRDVIGAYVEAVFECLSVELFGSLAEQTALFEKSALKMIIDSRWYFSTHYACAMGNVFKEQNNYQKRYNNITAYRMFIESELLKQNKLLAKLQTEKLDPRQIDELIKEFILTGMLHEFDNEVADAKSEERLKLQAIISEARESELWFSILIGQQGLLVNANNMDNVKIILQKFIGMADYYRKQIDLTAQLAKLPNGVKIEDLTAPVKEAEKKTDVSVQKSLSDQSTPSDLSDDSDDGVVFSPYSPSSRSTASPLSQESKSSSEPLTSPVSLNSAAAKPPLEKKKSVVVTVTRATSQLLSWMKKKSSSQKKVQRQLSAPITTNTAKLG